MASPRAALFGKTLRDELYRNGTDFGKSDFEAFIPAPKLGCGASRALDEKLRLCRVSG